MNYDRKILVEVLVYHSPTKTSGCWCGWAELGKSFPEHVANVYEDSVRVRNEASSLTYTQEQLDSMDQSARAYGWEVGRGHPIVEMLETTEGNPFEDPNWRVTNGIDEGDNERD